MPPGMFDDVGPRPPSRQPCSVAVLLSLLPPEDAAVFREKINDPDCKPVWLREKMVVLLDRDAERDTPLYSPELRDALDIAEQTLRRHKNKGCRCERRGEA